MTKEIRMRFTMGMVPLLGALAVGPAAAAAQDSTPPAPAAARDTIDALIAHARGLVLQGSGAAGRALLDSMAQRVPSAHPRYAEVLWWRAAYAETAAVAERDLLRLAVEFPVSPRAPEALVRLGQLELARGARADAVKHFDRVITQHPGSPVVGDAQLWKGRVLADAGAMPQACVAWHAARGALPSGDVERRNRLEFDLQRCAGVDTSGAAAKVVDLSAPPGTTGDTPQPAATGGRGAPAGRAGVATARGTFAVQVGSMATRSAADDLVKRAAAKGHDARVVGTKAPFKVWVGQLRTRAEAATLAEALKRDGFRGAFVVSGGR